jgi:predicted enzyme related to lactoylglutathione lyase
MRLATTERSRPRPLIRKVDAIEVPVPSLEEGLAFYRGRLGHELVWRTETRAGLRLPDTDAEIVLQTERPDVNIDLLVESAEAAAQAVVDAGGTVVVAPFDVRIGRAVVVHDPWGNRLVLLDMTKGPLTTDASGNVIGPAEQQRGSDRQRRARGGADQPSTGSASGTPEPR